ncbi:rhombosortase [Candidatus Enterovibrio altilux]|uniref:Rhombosortase n=2 Tax=Candidatus Enterovibrio altilux TaxID=1927128 RepID=A0A291B6W1_9GAMM|nr:rhombosortase [Candidatus Enterovibrio luxaltus]ATF08716.1 Rhombosortase [Candidatus Enterovibrio luxaltus]
MIVWDRVEIETGQWWRIVTGNITHTNEMHLAMNLAALVILTLLHRRYYDVRSLMIMMWCMMVVIGIAMFWSPFAWYAGLSGVLYGLFVWGVINDIKNKIPLGWMLLMGTIFKLIHEAYIGKNFITAELIGAEIAYQAHWAGAIIGVLFALNTKKVLYSYISALFLKSED